MRRSAVVCSPNLLVFGVILNRQVCPTFLITRRSKVQILPPQPRIFAHAEKGSRKGTGRLGALGPIINLKRHVIRPPSVEVGKERME